MKIQELYEKEAKKEGFFTNIEKSTEENDMYRNVLFTGDNLQLVVMSIPVGEEIGMEVHESGDQFIRVESGTAEFFVDSQTQIGKDGDSIVVPAGLEHNVVNVGDEPLKIYAIYSPPEHPPETQQKEK